ncbi:MlaD family protein [Nocardia sp. XZ_19_385]|uniref:MlaD family protein n=1 Tax=Nocardia sp. XZ_19_385 TaxID=2769488 RepID=UPI00189096E2|nr:MCE family protein [Nocardia sp. XZ_19_385]
MLLDPSGRGPTARHLTLAGIAMVLAFAVALALLMLRYNGYFDKKVPVVAELTSTGDGLPEHADVKFRGMVVGSVADVEVVAKGARQRASIHLKPTVAHTIPANVTARPIPSNIFGVTAIELVDNGSSPAKLAAGAIIPEDTSLGTTQLQTTLTVLRDVLDNIQPEKLGRVLATLAAALDPGARVPGSTIERLDNWLTQIHATPGIGNLLGDLGRATTELSRSAPELVGVLAESVTAARTLTEGRANLIALLSNASNTIDSVNGLFAANPNSAKELVPGLDQLFGSLAQETDAIPATVRNLNAALARLATVFHFGPSKQMVWAMDVSFTPFQQYTAQDCPRYGEVAGPRCGGSSVPEVAPAQEYPAQLAPRWLDAAGPAPVPAVPGLPGVSIPGLPGIAIPGLPAIPGLTAPAADNGAAPGVRPIAAGRGYAGVAAIVGGQPTAAQLLLLTPLLAGGSVTVYETSGGNR